jgi:hypothetical protein
MPRQQVEFEFPDPDKMEGAVPKCRRIELLTRCPDVEVEGAVGRETMKSPKDNVIIKLGT